MIREIYFHPELERNVERYDGKWYIGRDIARAIGHMAPSSAVNKLSRKGLLVRGREARKITNNQFTHKIRIIDEESVQELIRKWDSKLKL